MELFDGKSDSTLQDVEIEVWVQTSLRKQFYNTLEKSKATLKHLLLGFEPPSKTDKQNVFHSMLTLESLRVLSWYQACNVYVRLRRTSIKKDSQEDGSNTATPLRVLWYHDAGRSILEIKSSRFNNLVSLFIGSILSSSEWRTFLEGPSKSLKHLRVGFEREEEEDHSGVADLEFPNLEVLELIDGGRFPQWLLIPDSVKLNAIPYISNLPSISELWIWATEYYENDIINRLPKLKTLCFSYVEDLELVVETLIERKANVEADLHVDGVKMEMIKTLILPFNQSDPNLSDQLEQFLKRCRELVEVVEGNAQSRFIEVEY